jgi:hypothetical protein
MGILDRANEKEKRVFYRPISQRLVAIHIKLAALAISVFLLRNHLFKYEEVVPEQQLYTEEAVPVLEGVKRDLNNELAPLREQLQNWYRS